jgi:hypothetical protein
MGGILLIAFTSLISLLVLSRWAMSFFVWSIILGTWLFLLGMIVAAITGERGLKSGGSLISQGVHYAYLVGAFCSLLGCGFMLAGLFRAL